VISPIAVDLLMSDFMTVFINPHHTPLITIR
jgi:hypothetical protein